MPTGTGMPTLMPTMPPCARFANVRAECVKIAEERALVACEWEHADRHRDAHVDADHAAVRPLRERPGGVAALREDHRTVSERVGVHHGHAFLKILHPLDADHRTEDLLVTAAHAGLDMVEDARAEVETVFIAFDGHTTSVEEQAPAFLQA